MVPDALKVCIHPTGSRLGRDLIAQPGKRLLSVVDHSVPVAGSSSDGGGLSLAGGGSGRSCQRRIRLIFEPSRVKLYMRPLPSKMKPTMGLAILFVSIEAPTPTVIGATDPWTPT